MLVKLNVLIKNYWEKNSLIYFLSRFSFIYFNIIRKWGKTTIFDESVTKTKSPITRNMIEHFLKLTERNDVSFQRL